MTLYAEHDPADIELTLLRLIGGSLQIVTGPGRGTELHVRIPAGTH